MHKRAPTLAAAMAITGLVALPWTVQSETTKDSQTRQIEELLKQRLEILSKLVDVETAQYGQGTTTYASLVHATELLTEAELELAENRAERIGILRRRVVLMRDWVAMAEAKFSIGRATNATVLAARGDHLKARIELARAEIEEQ